MARMNPYITMFIGLIIGGFSAYLVLFNNTKSFLIFMLIGIVMFFYGLVINFIDKPEEKKRNKHPLEKWLIDCPFCKARIPNNAIFCPYCGRRLK